MVPGSSLSSLSLPILTDIPPLSFPSPAPTLSLLLPGSLTPSALLLTASTLFHTQRSPKADEYIRSIGKGPELVRAVEECVEAAGREWEGGNGGEAKELLRVRQFSFNLAGRRSCRFFAGFSHTERASGSVTANI